MAKSILTANIPGIEGKINVEGNIATEESILALISAFSSSKKISNRGIQDLNDNAEDAAENLDEFSDELDRAERSQKKLTDTVMKYAQATGNGIKGMQRFADSGGDLSSMVESVGGVAEGLARGIGGLVPIIGEGLGELGGAAAQAVVGLTTLAIGTIESYIGLNKSILNAGLQVEGGFGQFAQFAEDASLPINEFANAVMQSSDRLRLFGGGAPGGLRNVSNALKQLKDDGIMENLYSLGFTTEEVVAGMADYGIAAQRAGKNLSAEELATGSAQYLKNLRELSRLTGVSIKDQQAKVDADRANLFVQNALLDIAPAQRAAAENFAASIPEALAPIKDFIITGQSFSAESGLMANELSTFSGIYRNAFQAVADGTMSQEQAQAYLAKQLELNADAIAAEAERTTKTFGVAPDAMIQEGIALGNAIRSVREMVQAGIATDEAGGTEVVPGSMDETFGKLEATLNNVQSEIQSAFLDSVQLMAPAVTGVADSIDGTAELLGDFKRMIQGVLTGDFSQLNELLGTELENNTGTTMMENLQEAIAAAIHEGFNRVLGESWLGRRFVGDEERHLPPEDYVNPVDEFSGISGGMASGGVAKGPSSGYPMQLHGTEAVVPLPDGRNIPVEMTIDGMQRFIESSIAARENVSVNNITLPQNNDLDSPTTAQSLANGLDNTKTLPELVQINRNLLQQNFSLNEKIERLIRVTEESNNISRNSAYARA